MKIVSVLVLCVAAWAASVAPASAFVLTFDDIPAGKDLMYYTDHYGVSFFGWWITDHSGSSWGAPNSGVNVLTWNADPSWGAAFDFGSETHGHLYPQYSVRTVGAYFGTEQGTVLQMVGYRIGGSIAATAQIGDGTSAWSNQYVEIASSAVDIAYVHIRAVSPNAKYHFSMDDLTIASVPEPSSLLALLAGLGGLGAMLRRRQR